MLCLLCKDWLVIPNNRQQLSKLHIIEFSLYGLTTHVDVLDSPLQSGALRECCCYKECITSTAAAI